MRCKTAHCRHCAQELIAPFVVARMQVASASPSSSSSSHVTPGPSGLATASASCGYCILLSTMATNYSASGERTSALRQPTSAASPAYTSRIVRGHCRFLSLSYSETPWTQPKTGYLRCTIGKMPVERLYRTRANKRYLFVECRGRREGRIASSNQSFTSAKSTPSQA